MTTQAELIAAVAKDAGVSQADAGKVLTAIVENIHASLKSGGALLLEVGNRARVAAHFAPRIVSERCIVLARKP